MRAITYLKESIEKHRRKLEFGGLPKDRAERYEWRIVKIKRAIAELEDMEQEYLDKLHLESSDFAKLNPTLDEFMVNTIKDTIDKGFWETHGDIAIELNQREWMRYWNFTLCQLVAEGEVIAEELGTKKIEWMYKLPR